jgi:hypothetical protein
MPCLGGPTAEEILAQQEWDKLSEEEKISRRIAREILWKEQDEEFKKHEELSKKIKEKLLNNELENKTLENISFNSFMTVFLCNAMDIVVSNFGYKFVNNDLEWWYKEHKARDVNNDKSILSDTELAEKMIYLKNKYRVK